MGVKLTDSQRLAVENEGGGLLVSAAAGSGKTRVLVERLFRRVLGEERRNVDDFLIITYTRAAAAELRGRIAQELTERLALSPGDRHLQRQLLRVYRADIKTIDAFCTGLLRENVHLLDTGEERSLTADFRVLDESEASLLRRRVLGRVLEAFYAGMGPGAAQLADAFGFGRDDRGLEELVLDLHGKVQSHAYPLRWLEEQAALWRSLPADGGRTVYGAELLAGLGRKARHWAALLEDGVSQMADDGPLWRAYSPGFTGAARQLAILAERTEEGWDEAAAAAVSWPRLSAARGCEFPELKQKMKNLWDRCRAEMNAAQAVLAVSGAEAGEDLRRSAPAMEALLTLCADFSAAYQREKLRRNATDFSDQEHYAVRLLLGEDGRPTDLAAEVGRRYLEVMVDEYQDTNQVQNCIFSAVSRQGRALFTVGDVKQSIYRFRLADPTIFLEKYQRYPDQRQEEGGPRRILLSQNFRSRRPVIDAVNFVFQAIMSREMGEIDYGPAERLQLGAAGLPDGVPPAGGAREPGQGGPAGEPPSGGGALRGGADRPAAAGGVPGDGRGHRGAAALPAGGRGHPHALPRPPAALLHPGAGGAGHPLRGPGGRGLLLHHGGCGGLRPAADPGQSPAGRASHRRAALAPVRLHPRPAGGRPGGAPNGGLLRGPGRQRG